MMDQLMKGQFKSASLHDYISSAADIIEEARAGRMFILVDDEDRENEGDLVIPAQFATPDAINFMVRHARGLVCLAMTRQRVEQLGLPLMSQSNGTRHQTAFTISIEAAEGVTTGISAHDRARTIGVAINPESGRESIVTPGHIFPLVAREGGSLVRAGHTEAAVDIARLAGLTPAGVICEIMNDDGTMARLPDLAAFAQRHGLKLGTIADLIAHRRRTERLVKRVESGTLQHAIGGEWRLHVYANTVEYAEHLVLTRGDLAAPGPVYGAHAPGGPDRRRPARAALGRGAGRHAPDRRGGQGGAGADPRHPPHGAERARPRAGRASASAVYPARLRHRGADTGGAGRARHGAAVEHKADGGRLGWIWAEYRGPAAHRGGTSGMSVRQAERK